MSEYSGPASRLGVGVIGAGHVGPILGAALAGAGHALTGISAVSDRSRERAETILPGVPILTIPEVVRRSELVVLAVPDDQLPSLIDGLSATGAWQLGQLVAHTSPAHGIGVLDSARQAGAIPLAIHPAMAFTGTSLDRARLVNTWFAVTAAAPFLPIAQALVVEMGGEPVVIAEKDRPAYANAVAAAAAFSRSVVQSSCEALADCGVPQPGRLLGPLMRSALESALGELDSAQSRVTHE